eukprot:Clim_evm16s44 gene=Clim_evmTU16s44
MTDTEPPRPTGAPETMEPVDLDLVTSRVYVGNLAWSVRWQDLKDHMRVVGNVTYATVLQSPDGRSRGCGIVEYETIEEAKTAILQMTDTELSGRKIFVRKDREAQDPSDTSAVDCQIFVGNLDWGVSWQDLKDIFSQFGEVLRADVATDFRRRSRGYGTVRFATPEAATQAIEAFDGKPLSDKYERPLQVRHDQKANQYRMGNRGGRGGRGRGSFRP